MTETLHKNAPLIDMHPMVAFSFASATLRRAQGGLTSADIGKVAMQTDTTPCSLWAIIAVASGTATWSRIDTGAEVTVTGPLAIMAGHIRAGYSGDVGLTTTTWQDQGPSSRHLAGTCSVAAAALGGKNCMQTNGTSNVMSLSFAIPAPGTTPSYIWAVVRNDANAAFANVVSLGASNENAIIRDSANEVCLVYGGFGARHAAGFTLSAFKRVRALFTGTGTDLVQVGSGSAVTAAPASNTAGNGIFLGQANGTYGANTYAEVWVFDQDPGGTNLAALDAWASAKYSTSFP